VNQPPPDAAAVWALLRDFVDRNSPRFRIRAALGESAGKGKTKVHVLMMLADGPLSLGDIAERERVDRPYATAIVDQLEAQGFAERTADPGDRRRKLVRLTERGRAASLTAREIYAEPPAGLAALSPAELHQLAGLLERL
jgi:DNA-binding MarR family transcriptional regulator